jgi:hypothetical protein
VQKSEVRAAKSERTGLSSVLPDCPVQQEDKRLQRATAPNPNCLLTWQTPDNEQCVVWCTTGLSNVSLTTIAGIVVGAINTSQPTPFKSSKPPILLIQYKSKGKHSKDTIKAFNPLCWGEGKDATLRSRPSLQPLVRQRQSGQGHPSQGSAL